VKVKIEKGMIVERPRITIVCVSSFRFLEPGEVKVNKRGEIMNYCQLTASIVGAAETALETEAGTARPPVTLKWQAKELERHMSSCPSRGKVKRWTKNDVYKRINWMRRMPPDRRRRGFIQFEAVYVTSENRTWAIRGSPGAWGYDPLVPSLLPAPLGTPSS
jgi:hypothetical protein